MRRNFLIFVLVVIATAVLYFFFVFSPQSERIKEASESADAAEAKVSRLTLELRRLQALQKDAPRLRQEAQVLDSAMPNDPQLAQFLLMVQEQADASGIDWISVNPAPPIVGPQPNVSEITIAMNVSGGYFQVQDFLVRLETLSRALKIDTLGLTPLAAAEGDSAGGSPELTTSLTMKMFVSSISAAPATTAAEGT